MTGKTAVSATGVARRKVRASSVCATTPRREIGIFLFMQPCTLLCVSLFSLLVRTV